MRSVGHESTSAASVESPPVAAVAGDALPLKRGRFFVCPKPYRRSISDRLPLPFRSPVPAVARRNLSTFRPTSAAIEPPPSLLSCFVQHDCRSDK